MEGKNTPTISPISWQLYQKVQDLKAEYGPKLVKSAIMDVAYELFRESLHSHTYARVVFLDAAMTACAEKRDYK